MRSRSPSSEHLGAVPSCAGLFTRFACARACEAGVDLRPLLHCVRLTLREIEDESVSLKVASQIECLNLIADAVGDRLLGFHLLQKTDVRQLRFLYYVAASSETLGDALRRIARYSVLANEGMVLAADIGRSLRVRFDYAGVSRLTDRHQIEAWMTSIVRVCRDMTRRDLQLIAVKIMHRRIAESNQLDSFFGCTVEFGADRDEIVFVAEAAALPVIGADPYLNRVLLDYCEHALVGHKAASGGLRVGVENVIAALLPHGQTRLDVVARKLGIAPRTLRRKLAAKGLTFARILDEFRLSMAKRYLTEQDLSVSRIAWLLGYTEVSGFSHAFRRWTGRNPRADRRNPRAAAPARPRRRRARP